jgi:hypothetical protein
MRTASILLASIVVLGSLNEASAEICILKHDYTIALARSGSYGLQEYIVDNNGTTWTVFWIGRTYRNVPFTATQGLIGSCAIVAGLIALPAMCTLRWKKKRATP